jgi:putative oxidoreductase
MKHNNIAPLFIRLMVGLHLVSATKGAAFNGAKMQGVVKFFTSLNIPAPSVMAPLAVYAELICGVLFILGFFTRASAAIMVFVFICAILLAHRNDGYDNTFPALVMLAGSLSLLFSGAGKISIDSLMKTTPHSMI